MAPQDIGLLQIFYQEPTMVIDLHYIIITFKG